MATGDIKGNLHRLQTELKHVRYPKDLDYASLAKGVSMEFLPILHYVMCDYSRPLAEVILASQIDLGGKSDQKFMEAVYRILRDLFGYVPKITGPQFFSRGFAEHKILLTIDVVSMVRLKHKQLVKGKSAGRSRSGQDTKSSKKVLREPDVVPMVQLGEVLPSPDEFRPSLNSTIGASATSPTPVSPPTPGQQNTPAVKIVIVGQKTGPAISADASEDSLATPESEVLVPRRRGRVRGQDEGYSTKESSPTFDAVIYDRELRTHPVIRELAIIVGDLVNRVGMLEEQVDTLTITGKKTEHRNNATHVLLENRIKLLESELSVQSGMQPRQPVLQQGFLVDTNDQVSNNINNSNSPRQSPDRSLTQEVEEVVGHSLDTVEEESSALFIDESASLDILQGRTEEDGMDKSKEEDQEVVVIEDKDEGAHAVGNGDIQAQVERIQSMMTDAQKALNMNSSLTTEVS